jgi:hypothetical protein
MQADCFAEYLRCVRENTTGALTDDLVGTATLITCVNAHLYGSLGEHLVDRSGEADVTGKAFLEVGLVVKVLERHSTSVQKYADRARAISSTASGPDQATLRELEGDLEAFVQTVIQDLQERHPSD